MEQGLRVAGQALRALRARRASLLLASLVTVLLWPVGSFTVTPGLDPSWAAGLHLASREGLVWGRDVVFTYGPLGFVVDAHPYTFGTWVIAMVAHLAACFLLAYALVALLSRRLPRWAAGLVTFGLMLLLAQLLLVTQPFLPAMLVLVVVLWCGDRIARRQPVHSFAILATGSVGAATVLLVKIDAGVAVALTLGYTFLVLGMAAGGWRLAVRTVLTWVGGTTLCLVGEWLLLGQPLGALPDWLRTSAWLTGGYASAMAGEWEEYWEYLAAGIVVLVTLLLVVRGTYPTPATRWLVLGFVLLVTFVALKQGFVRHDSVHVAQFFALSAVLPVAFISAWPRREVLALVAVASLVLFVSASVSIPDLFDPGDRVDAISDTAALLVSGGRRAEWAADERAALREHYDIPPAIARAIRGHTVAVEPTEVLVAFAEPDTTFDPLPVFQTYAAFTTALDDLNADFLRSPRRPEFVLRALDSIIDGRLDRFESPAAQLALVCGYTTVATNRQWQLLRATGPRCDDPSVLSSVTARAGASVRVPGPEPGHLVAARFEGIGDSATEKLRALVFRGTEQSLQVDGGRSYRFVTGTQESLHVLAGPACAMRDLAGPDGRSISRIALDPGGGDDTFRVEFVSVPVRCG